LREGRESEQENQESVFHVARILSKPSQQTEFRELVSPPFLVGGEVGEGLLEDGLIEGADQANINAQSSRGSFLAAGVGMFEGLEFGPSCGL